MFLYYINTFLNKTRIKATSLHPSCHLAIVPLQGVIFRPSILLASEKTSGLVALTDRVGGNLLGLRGVGVLGVAFFGVDLVSSVEVHCPRKASPLLHLGVGSVLDLLDDALLVEADGVPVFAAVQSLDRSIHPPPLALRYPQLFLCSSTADRCAVLEPFYCHLHRGRTDYHAA